MNQTGWVLQSILKNVTDFIFEFDFHFVSRTQHVNSLNPAEDRQF